jgi:hypothetical protein
VNHHLRSFYRGLAALTALACIAFGVIGTWGSGSGAASPDGPGSAVGLGANVAASALALLIGVVVLVALVIGRNIDAVVNTVIGAISIMVGLVMLTVLRTEANVLHFSVGTCVSAFLVGIVLSLAGLYGRVGSAVEQRREEAFRHGGPDPELHPWHEDEALHPEGQVS